MPGQTNCSLPAQNVFLDCHPERSEGSEASALPTLRFPVERGETALRVTTQKHVLSGRAAIGLPWN